MATDPTKKYEALNKLGALKSGYFRPHPPWREFWVFNTDTPFDELPAFIRDAAYRHNFRVVKANGEYCALVNRDARTRQAWRGDVILNLSDVAGSGTRLDVVDGETFLYRNRILDLQGKEVHHGHVHKQVSESGPLPD